MHPRGSACGQRAPTTIVAAAVLLAVLIGVLASLAAASHTTAVNRGRTVAAALAEQDVERRSSASACSRSS